MKNNFVLTKNIRTEGDRRLEAQEAYAWEDEMHRQEDCSSNFQHDPIRSVNLIHEISEMLDVKPPKYFFYDGNDTTWGGYQNGSNIVMRISAPISTTIHEMAHYIDDVHEKHRTGYGHGSSFKEILSLINIELGYWSRDVFDERDYVRVFHTYMPKATVEKVRDVWSSGLKKILEAYEKELQAEEERNRRIKEFNEQKALQKKRVTNAIKEILMECLDISTIKSTLNQNMESGHYPCFQYYRAIFGNQPVLNWDHWDEDSWDYFIEDWYDEVADDIPMLLSRDKDPKETLISHFRGVEDFICEFTNWLIDREYEMAEEFAWYNNPHILYVIDHDAYLDNKHDFDKDFLEEIDAQRALYKEYCQQLTMTNFTEEEEEILNKYYPPRTGYSEEFIEKDEWGWMGEEHDELIPWSFWNDVCDSEETFLVLYYGWNGYPHGNDVMSFTSIDRLPYQENSIHESYETIVRFKNNIWKIIVTENMSIHWVGIVQHLPEHYRIEEIQIKIIGEYFDGEKILDLEEY